MASAKQRSPSADSKADSSLNRLELAAPALRAFGFYRAPGWRSTGEQREADSEVLELSPEAEL